VLLFWLAAGVACHATAPPEADVTAVPVWDVYRGPDRVLVVRGEPGPITSTAPPPADGRVATNPYLSAAALDASCEAELGGLLQQATSLDDFLARLRAAGFRVERER
jgi:hypothetical protein